MIKKESVIFWGLFLILSLVLTLITINLVVVIMIMIATMFCSPTILTISIASCVLISAMSIIVFSWNRMIDEFFF